MDTIIQKLHEISGELLDAIDVEEIDRFGTLLARRGELLAALQTAWDAASTTERQSVGPALAELQRLDGELRARGAHRRDGLARQIAGGTSSASRPAPASISGVLDRRA